MLSVVKRGMDRSDMPCAFAMMGVLVCALITSKAPPLHGRGPKASSKGTREWSGFVRVLGGLEGGSPRAAPRPSPFPALSEHIELPNAGERMLLPSGTSTIPIPAKFSNCELVFSPHA